MAFTVADFEDLVRLLEEQPEFRARLRSLILGPEWQSEPSRLDRIEPVLDRPPNGGTKPSGSPVP